MEKSLDNGRKTERKTGGSGNSEVKEKCINREIYAWRKSAGVPAVNVYTFSVCEF
jgi:hypothetical protein